MQRSEELIKEVLLDMVATGMSWETAYADLRSLIENDGHVLRTQGREMSERLDGKPDAYRALRLEPFTMGFHQTRYHLFELHCLEERKWRGDFAREKSG